MSDPCPTDPTFEQAMERLEEIVSAMEGDRMPLDEMVTSYEEGMRLLKVCRDRIETARRRVELISSGGDGKPALVPFDPATAEAAAEPAGDAAKPAAAARRRPPPPPARADADEPDEIRLF